MNSGHVLRILILGATGMLGHTVFRYLSSRMPGQVLGVVRAQADAAFFSADLQPFLRVHSNWAHEPAIAEFLQLYKPTEVINCIGVVKQSSAVNDLRHVIPINTRLPHLLAHHCGEVGARLIHFSTDCVFSGAKGWYSEDDIPDVDDIYGLSKLYGEPNNNHCLTLRTSIIGPELKSKQGLLEWFLAQSGCVQGYRGAVFNGLPTVEVARVLLEQVLPSKLTGLFHLGCDPINKFDLLRTIADCYGKVIDIRPSDDLNVNKSLNYARLSRTNGYKARPWPQLIETMKAFN